MPSARRWRCFWFLAAVGCAGCLPNDDRPTPGKVTATIEPDAAATNGFDTSDGWHVHFDRLLAGVGSLSLDSAPPASGGPRPSGADATCVDYTDSSYNRLYDFARLTGPVALGVSFGLGDCVVGYRARSPSPDALLGPGITADDVATMRTQDTDAYVTDGRINFLVSGSATRASAGQGGPITKRFTWAFRRGARVTGCTDINDASVDQFQFTANSTFSLKGVVEPETLFRMDLTPDAALVFNPFASADGDGDGDVTLEELARVTVTVEVPPDPSGSSSASSSSSTGSSGSTGSGDFGGAQPAPPKTLADLVYEWLAPRAFSVAGATSCRTTGR